MRTALSCLLVAAAATTAGAQFQPELIGRVDSFRPLASFGVDGVAEIVAATGDGRTLAYTNSDKGEIGIVDIRNPRAPRAAASIPVRGEPTSVDIRGNWGVAAVWVDKPEEGEDPPQFRPGQLVVFDLSRPNNPRVAGAVPIGWHPDNVKLTRVGRRLVAILAIENEPVIVDGDGKVTDDDVPGNPNDVSPAGFVQVITIDTDNPSASRVVDVRFRPALLAANGLLFPEDAQPEFVTLKGTQAAVSLQENNGIAMIDIADPAAPALVRVFNLGVASDRVADLTEDDDINFNERYPSFVDGVRHDIPTDGAGNPVAPGSRFPDAIAFSPDGSVIYSADEGEMNYTGGRGFSAWSPDGTELWDDGGLLERISVALSHYPEGRSENKGIEIEGVATARFGRNDFAFVLSERGSSMSVFNINNPRRPFFVQMLPTGISPEGVIAIRRAVWS